MAKAPRPEEKPALPLPEVEAFGIMIQVRTQREMDLTLALVMANRRIAELEAMLS